MDLKKRLKQLFGFSDFREGQEHVIHHILAGNSSLAIFPTGSGKSLCYQFSAMQLAGVTLVVSPLLALIKDQVDFLVGKGVAAASLDSSQSTDENRAIMQQAKQGKIKILMVSVERFNNETFRHFLTSIQLSLLVVDEAHCISEWGHNFRPDYLKLPDYRQAFNIPQVLLLTATATAAVKRDMAEKFSIPSSNIVQTGFYRANLDLTVLSASSAQKQSLLLQQLQTSQGACIIYVTLQQSAESLAQWLNAQKAHLPSSKEQETNEQWQPVQAYHAGLTNEKREQIQQNFMLGKTPYIVATIAFGMGIDKADIRTVIHYDLPKSIENYSQEIGRAGRDGLASKCLTLASLDGLSTLENFVYGDTPEHIAINKVLEKIKQETNEQGEWEVQLLSLANTVNIRQLPLKTLLVQLELMGIITSKYAYHAQYRYKLLTEADIVTAQFDDNRATFITQIFNATHFKRIWGEPDFSAWPYEERERAIKALNYLDEQGLIELEAKQLTQVYLLTHPLDITSVSRVLTDYFHAKEQSEIERLQNLLAFFQLPTCLNHALANYFDDTSAPQSCGHCSSCRGATIELINNAPQVELDKELMKKDIAELQHAFTKHLALPETELTLEVLCRFFAGITTPYLTKCRAKNLTGFGRYQQIRYTAIRTALTQISM